MPPELQRPLQNVHSNQKVYGFSHTYIGTLPQNIYGIDENHCGMRETNASPNYNILY